MTILTSAPPSFILTDEDGILIGSSGGTSLLTGGTEGQAPIVQGDGSIAWGAAGASSLSELDDWDTDTLVVPGDLSVNSGLLFYEPVSNTVHAIKVTNGSTLQLYRESSTLSLSLTAAANYSYSHLRPSSPDSYSLGADNYEWANVYANTLIVRQSGGVAGTDEVQISHNGGDAYIVPQSGNLYFTSDGTDGPHIYDDQYLMNPAGSGDLSNLAIGYLTSIPNGTGNIAIGRSAVSWTGSSNQLAIGMYALSRGDGTIGIGYDCQAYGAYSIAIGKSTECQAAQSWIGIGYNAGTTGFGVGNYSIAIGDAATNTADNQLAVNKVYDVYIGNGVTNASPENITYHATGGSGTDIAGASLYLAGGMGTGTGVGGDVIIQHAPAGSSGTSLNSLVDVVKVDSQGLTVLQPGGVAGTDEIQIYHDGTDGYIDSQSGKLVLSAATDVDTTGSGFRMGEGSYLMETSTWAGAGFIFRYSGSQKFGVGASMRINNTASLSWTSDSALNTPNVAIGYRESKVLGVSGAWGIAELSADPSDPSEGESVIWQSDGTGSGDDGDIMMKITAGGITKTTTLVDFSAV